MLFSLLLPFFFLFFPSPSSCEFLEPSFYVQWRIGDIERIAWKTDFRKYTVALWQRYGEKNKDIQMGRRSILYQTTEGDGNEHSIQWPVQTYGLDLDISNKFFLWLFEGNETQQGNKTAYHAASTYFLIRAALPDSTVTSSSTSTSTPTSTSIPTETATTPVIPTKSRGPGPSEGLSWGQPSGSMSQSSSNNNLSRSATIGIAVGISVISIAILAVVLLWWRYLKNNKKKKKKEEHHLPSSSGGGDGRSSRNARKEASTPPPFVSQPTTAPLPTKPEDFLQSMRPPPPSPVEMPTNYHNRPLPSYYSEPPSSITPGYCGGGKDSWASNFTTPTAHDSNTPWHVRNHPALK